MLQRIRCPKHYSNRRSKMQPSKQVGHVAFLPRPSLTTFVNARELNGSRKPHMDKFCDRGELSSQLKQLTRDLRALYLIESS
jgi:hypothetical protein